MAKQKTRKTTVGQIAYDVLEYTAGSDAVLDLSLVEADCLGSAAHAVMLSKMPVRPRLLTAIECRRVVAELARIIRQASRGKFTISVEDQDVHLAVERILTRRLGDLGKKIHTGRSRNDQVAVDLRIFARKELLDTISEALVLAGSLAGLAGKHVETPMVGRTHMQPAMPSSVALWASSYVECLLDDVDLLFGAYSLNNRCPLGAAAGYGTPLPINRKLVSDLLAFDAPVHNTLYAVGSRGKVESVILHGMAQVMGTLSRIAEDLIMYSMPEFGYFELPPELCTGSSIMPQKKNPDVLELVRARASTVTGFAFTAMDLIKGLPSGYNRDLQEVKEPFMKGIALTRAGLRMINRVVPGMYVNIDRLAAGFTPAVFATDHALDLVAGGMPFRDAYNHVKSNIDSLDALDPEEAIARKKHTGATGGLDLDLMIGRIEDGRTQVAERERSIAKAIRKLMSRGRR